MSRTLRILAGVVAVCAAAGLAGHEAGAGAQGIDKNTALVVFDATLVERLQQLQADHRKAHAQALKDPKKWDEGRAARADLDRAELAKLWGNLVDNVDAQARLRLHADHMARLNRMLDLAEASADAALITRIQTAIQTELQQHAQNMQLLRATLRSQ
jgi:hypothetical protein